MNTALELIRCPRCAKELPASSQFCRRCGYTIAWNVATVPPPPIYSKPLPPLAAKAQPRPARRTAPPTPSAPRAGGVMTVVAIIAAVFFFTRVSTRSFIPPSPIRSVPTFTPPAYTYPSYPQPYTTPTKKSSSSTLTRIGPMPPPPAPILGPTVIPGPGPGPWNPIDRSRYNYPYPTDPRSSQKPTRDH